MARPARRTYPPELRQQAVELVFRAIEQRDGVRFGVVARVARQLDLPPALLRYWVGRAESVARDVAQQPEAAPAEEVRHVDPPAAEVRSVDVRPVDSAAAVTLARALRVPMGLYLASRVVALIPVIVAAHQAHTGLAHMTTSRMPWPPVPPSGHFAGALATWDAAWYVRLAGHGYNPVHAALTSVNKDLAFFPLFPLLIRGVMFLTGAGAVVAGIVVTFVVGAVATAAVWVVAQRLVGAEKANGVVAVWAFFPGAFVFSLIYSEGLTIACAAVCLLALLRRRWFIAGLAGAAATATQPAALVLLACCGWEAAAALRSRREWVALVAPLLAPIGALAYFGYLWTHAGRPTVWFAVERTFWAHRRLGPFWTVVRPVVRSAANPASVDDGIRVAGLVLTLIACYLLWRWRPPAVVSIWAIGTIGLALMSAPVGARPRFILTAFPLIFAVGHRLPRSALYAVAAVEAPLLALLTFVMVTSMRTIP